MTFVYDTQGFEIHFRITETPEKHTKLVYYLGNGLAFFNSSTASNKTFINLVDKFNIGKPDFFGKNRIVCIEIFGKMSVTSNIHRINDLNIWIREFFLPKLKFLIFPDFCESVYSSTKKQTEKIGYSLEKHMDLYKKQLTVNGKKPTPVEIVIYSRFDFENILTY